MSSRKDEIIKIMDEYPQYRELLFARGYLITDDESIDYAAYPFFGNWTVYKFGQYRISVNAKQSCYIYEKDNCQLSIIGHAYNPFNMMYEEEKILEDLYTAYKKSEEDFYEKVNELTGIHLIVVNDNGRIIAVQDCTGSKACCFAKVNDKVYICQISQMLADMLDLSTDEFVYKLVNTKCYNIGNRYLPGSLTPYKGVKRLGPNTSLEYSTGKFKVKRFYPVRPHAEVRTQSDYDKRIADIYKIFSNNLKLALLKWNKPVISLSGGTDSKTTLACANGLYDKFSAFSFHCKPSEQADAYAAHQICENIGVEHKIYPIPDSNDEIEDFGVLKQILEHNTSYYKKTADNEVRKYIYLMRLNEFDVELKSWTSELGRAFYAKKYGIKFPELLNERQYSILQTRFFGHPVLLRKNDAIYREFLKETELDRIHFNFETMDFVFWEVRKGAWSASVVSSFDFCHEVTIPYNNRNLMEMFLEFTHEDRRKDNVHNSLMKYANSEIYDMHIDVHNASHKSYRILLEKAFYYYKTMFFRSKM